MNFPLFERFLAEAAGGDEPTEGQCRLAAISVKVHLNDTCKTTLSGNLYLMRLFAARPEVKEACANTVTASDGAVRENLSFSTRMQNSDARLALIRS